MISSTWMKRENWKLESHNNSVCSMSNRIFSQDVIKCIKMENGCLAISEQNYYYSTYLMVCDVCFCVYIMYRNECSCSCCNSNGYLCWRQSLPDLWGKKFIEHNEYFSKHLLWSFIYLYYELVLVTDYNMFFLQGLSRTCRWRRQHQSCQLAKREQHHPTGRSGLSYIFARVTG